MGGVPSTVKIETGMGDASGLCACGVPLYNFVTGTNDEIVIYDDVTCSEDKIYKRETKRLKSLTRT